MSRLHCVFEVDIPKDVNTLPTITIQDKSKLGTFLNGVRINKDEAPPSLKVGDILSLGSLSEDSYQLVVERWHVRLHGQWLSQEEEGRVSAAAAEIGVPFFPTREWDTAMDSEDGPEDSTTIQMSPYPDDILYQGPLSVTSGIKIGYEALAPLLRGDYWTTYEYLELIRDREADNTTRGGIPQPWDFTPPIEPGEAGDRWGLKEADFMKIEEAGMSTSIFPDPKRTSVLTGLYVLCLQDSVAEEIGDIARLADATLLLSNDIEEDYEVMHNNPGKRIFLIMDEMKASPKRTQLSVQHTEIDFSNEEDMSLGEPVQMTSSRSPRINPRETKRVALEERLAALKYIGIPVKSRKDITYSILSGDADANFQDVKPIVDLSLLDTTYHVAVMTRPRSQYTGPVEVILYGEGEGMSAPRTRKIRIQSQSYKGNTVVEIAIGGQDVGIVKKIRIYPVAEAEGVAAGDWSLHSVTISKGQCLAEDDPLVKVRPSLQVFLAEEKKKRAEIGGFQAVSPEHPRKVWGKTGWFTYDPQATTATPPVVEFHAELKQAKATRDSLIILEPAQARIIKSHPNKKETLSF